MAWVARILIEQHANVDTMVHGVSVLDLACIFEDWETIALLLKHKARVSPETASSFKRFTDRQRFVEMVQSASAERVRPPRVCPCWSGQSVPDCHGSTSKDYPPNYVCICGTGKTYAMCCHMRGNVIKEKWDNTSQRILHSYDRDFRLPDEFRARYGPDVVASLNAVMRHAKSTPAAPSGLDIKELARQLCSQKVIDPAFAYAVERSGWVPG